MRPSVTASLSQLPGVQEMKVHREKLASAQTIDETSPSDPEKGSAQAYIPEETITSTKKVSIIEPRRSAD